MKNTKIEWRWFVFFCIISIAAMVAFALYVADNSEPRFLVKTIVIMVLWSSCYLINHIINN